MPKFYCEYCSIYLTHSSPAGRKQHSQGRKHINAKVDYYQKLVRERFFQPPAFIVNQQMPYPTSIPPVGQVTGVPRALTTIQPPNIKGANSIPIPAHNTSSVGKDDKSGK